jgi:uncharacterized membrane protein YtjA (UPF0391 family)
MLGWTISFLILALIAGIFGYGNIAAGATSIAQVVFFVFLVLLVASIVIGVVRRGNTKARV